MYVLENIFFFSQKDNYGQTTWNGKTYDAYTYGVFLVFTVTMLTHGIIF